MTHRKKKVKGITTLVPKTQNIPTPGKVIANQTFGFGLNLLNYILLLIGLKFSLRVLKIILL